MQKLKEADIFSTDTQFTVMGVEAISNWKTKVATFFILISAITISLTSVKQIWSPLSSLPVTTRLISSNLTIDPFIIAVNYTEQLDKGNVHFYYKNQTLEEIPCPQRINSPTFQCFITPLVNLTQSNITMTSSVTSFYSLFLEVFSLNYLLHNKSEFQTFYKVAYMSNIATIIKLNIIQLSLQNSIYNTHADIHTLSNVDSITTGLRPEQDLEQQLFSLASFQNQVSSSQTVMKSIICSSSSDTSIQYQLKRITLLSVLSVFVSWIQTLSSIAGVIVIINLFTMKSHISQKLYQSRYNQNFKNNRWKGIKLWLYGALCGLGIRNILRKMGCFKEEDLLNKAYTQVDHKLSINNLFRAMYSVSVNKDQSQICFRKILHSKKQTTVNPTFNTVQSIIPPSDVQPSDKQLEEQINLNYDFSQDVKYTPYAPMSAVFPVQKQKFLMFRTILENLNFNAIRIKLLSKRNQKSSIFSIIVTCIAVSMIVPAMIYLGAFSQKATVMSETRLPKQLEFKFTNQSKFFIKLAGQEEDNLLNQSKMSPATIKIVILDEKNQIVQSYDAQPNCTDTLEEQQIKNCYCFSHQLVIKKAMVDNTETKLGIIIDSPQFITTVQISYASYVFTPDKIRKKVQRLTTILMQNQYKKSTLTLLQKNIDGHSENMYEISEFQDIDFSIQPQKRNRGFIISLSRQLKIFKVNDRFVLSYFRNIWSINYAFFTLLLTLIIFPYNNRIAKGNILSRVKDKRERTSNTVQSEIQEAKREEEEMMKKQQMVFSMENMMQLLYSKFYEMKVETPFVKRKIN